MLFLDTAALNLVYYEHMRLKPDYAPDLRILRVYEHLAEITRQSAIADFALGCAIWRRHLASYGE